MSDPQRTQAPARVAVVGGGIAGLATALHLLDGAARQGLVLDVTVFEADATPGGNLRTLRRDGWQLEWGPNGFLDNEPATLRLVDRLDLRDSLQRSSDLARRRFLLIGGRLREIPTAPRAFLGSDLLSLRGKLRVAGELFVPGRRDLGRAADDPTGDETVAAFGTRRLGREFAETLLDPMVKGIYGGNATRLSLAAAFPRMVELERDHGGLFRAMFALGRQRRRQRKRDQAAGTALAPGATDGAKPATGGPSGTLHAFTGGMAELIAALVRDIEAQPRATVRTGAPVMSLQDGEDGWRVSGDGFDDGPFAAVVEAAPAHAAARHLQAALPEVGAALAEIPFAPMAVVALGFPRTAVAHDLQGFGFLVPGKERRDLLGSLWTSSIFSGRAPDERVLLRNMLGGAENPGVMELDDETLVNLTLAELRPLLGLRGRPELVEVIRHRRAIAQYEVGHLARLRAVEQAASRRPGLYLTGSSYRGIAVNSCVKEAEILAETVLKDLSSRAEPVAHEGVS